MPLSFFLRCPPFPALGSVTPRTPWGMAFTTVYSLLGMGQAWGAQASTAVAAFPSDAFRFHLCCVFHHTKRKI